MSSLLYRAQLGRRSTSPVVDRFPDTMFIGDLDAGNGYKWQQIFADDFSGYPDLPVGSFDVAASGELKSTCAAYPWMQSKWSFYPDTWNSTHGGKIYPITPGEPGYLPDNPDGTPGAYHDPINAKYWPTKTLSIETVPGIGKVMQVYHHTENIGGIDTFLGANMKPKNPTGVYKFDPFYRVQYKMRATEVIIGGVNVSAANDFTTSTNSYMHWVPLGIDSSNWPVNGEIDWWEGALNRALAGNYHPASSTNQTFHVNSGENPFQWHRATVEWQPNSMKWWTDRTNRLSTTDRVPTGPMAWQLQHESDWRQPPLSATAKVQIADVAIWRRVLA